jgi:hypothetical protein
MPSSLKSFPLDWAISTSAELNEYDRLIARFERLNHIYDSLPNYNQLLTLRKERAECLKKLEKKFQSSSELTEL